MQLENTPMTYGAGAKTLHWLIAAMIVLQFVLAPIPENLPPGVQIQPPFGLDKLGVLTQHKSFGMTVLMLMILRCLWRLRNPAPALPVAMSRVQRGLAHASHTAFYVILLCMPLSGWLMTQAKGSSASWFGLWTWPTLIAKNDAAFNALRLTHDTLSRVLFILACIHVLAALKHQFWNKDGVLLRMLPFTRINK